MSVSMVRVQRHYTIPVPLAARFQERLALQGSSSCFAYRCVTCEDRIYNRGRLRKTSRWRRWKRRRQGWRLSATGLLLRTVARLDLFRSSKTQSVR